MTDEDVGRACTERLDYNNVLDISLQRKKKFQRTTCGRNGTNETPVADDTDDATQWWTTFISHGIRESTRFVNTKKTAPVARYAIQNETIVIQA